jgi:hypothetical protein
MDESGEKCTHITKAGLVLEAWKHFVVGGQ